MEKNIFRGLGVAIVTPFLPEVKEVDFTALRKLIGYLLDHKVDYLVLFGTTGETPTLKFQEKQKIKEFVLEVVDSRVPLVIGIGGNDTEDVIRKVSSLSYVKGFSAILSVCPYYNKPSQRGIIAHYVEIAKKSKLPIILYNVPSRTGVNMEVSTTLELANVPNIIGVKEASGNLVQIANIINGAPDDFLVISGDDALALPSIALGADGVISVIANAFPSIFSAMVARSLKGDFGNARYLYYELLPMINLIFKEGSPNGIKQVLEIMNICLCGVRSPLFDISFDLQQEIRKEFFSLKSGKLF